MYKYNLTISIFSEDKNIGQIIDSIQPLENFKHQINTYGKTDYEIISTSDVIIWDLEEDIIRIKDYFKKDSKIILCTSKYKSSFEIFDSIIIKPFESGYLKYCVTKVLEAIKIEEDLYYTKTCLNTTIDGIPDMFWIKSIDGIHTLINKEFCNIVGKKREDVIGKNHYDIWDVSPDDPNSGADICKKTEDNVIAAGQTLRFTESVKSQNGIRQLVTYKSPLYDKHGKIIGTVGFGHDITDLKNMSVENEILLNSVPYAVLLRDNNGKIQNINNYFETYFNVNKETIIGTYYDDWVKKTFYPQRRINGGGYPEGTTYSINGEEKIVELRFNDIRDIFDNITGHVCIFRDVTLERKLESQIIESSNVDFMTKLYNRKYLDKFIYEQSKDSLLSFFSIDLDHFKDINDTYGHKAGDEAIILTADILKNFFKENLVVRMGGDEFLVVQVGNYDMNKLEEEAQNLLDTLSRKFKENEKFNILSASIGISQGSLQDEGIDILLQYSDKALYESKAKGRACYSVYR